MTELILIVAFVVALALGTAAGSRWTAPMAIIGILLLVVDMTIVGSHP